MLKIFYDLELFFEDVYREISVREYAREMKISPPTASKLLNELKAEELLVSTDKGVYRYFRAHRDGYVFRELAKLYWYSILHVLTEKIREEIAFRRIVLFGSLAKAENTNESDVDLFLDADERKIDVKHLQKVLGRDVQLHFAQSLRNEHLKKNINKGIVL